MIETKRCSLCCENPPYKSCFAREDGVTDTPVCARLVMYENVKLPAPPTAYTHEVEGEVVAKARYDEMRSYAARLACDLLMLNGMIQKAAKDAEGYIGAVHNAEKERS